MFKLEVKPVFSAEVPIPVPGAAPEKVVFEFKHKTRDEFDEMAESVRREEITTEDFVREVVVGWKAPGIEFTKEALETCFQIFPGSPYAIFSEYRRNLIEGGRKN